ncbi:AraC family transcriptional regulator [Paenibacillus sp. J5C_2022]|uniref:AraC family transcriptional regulator n=1 Tax=Paenibacillus sp. J5C2022 TaxID=2977129 RepID=UPI0021D0B7EB|nr:AraC family transcriptional regulator [Paenibacillus sp. J5C2022]MCU6707935.1 AraC family transcriptional regulator [Paenibacillus sp. J5C2022]
MSRSIIIPYPSEAYLDVNYLQRQQGWSKEPHRHAYHQLIWVTEGMLQMHIADKPYELKPGMLCLIPPDMTHNLYTPSGYVQFGLNLNHKTASDMRSLLLSHMTELTIVNYAHMQGKIAVMLQLGEHASKLSRLKLANELDALLIAIIEHSLQRSEAEFRLKLLQKLRQHLTGKLTLLEIARHFCMSPSHLERLVHREFGCGAIELHNQLRIEQACTRLIQSEDAIELIAHELGFYDASHFSRYFKQKMGLSPTQYRRASYSD